MEPFLGEVRMFAPGIVPRGWMACQGQMLAISQNQALFSILGTQYGGDGVTTFKLPDLRGRLPIGVGPVNPLGQASGETAHILTEPEMPVHTHRVSASSVLGDQWAITGKVWASSMNYADSVDAPMLPSAIGTSGAGAPHNNMQPYLAVNFCIALSGIYPPRP